MIFQDVLNKPTDYFDTPDELVSSDDLTLSEKIKILRKWEEDAHQMAVASEEGMNDGEPSMLHSIKMRLSELNARTDDSLAPTK